MKESNVHFTTYILQFKPGHEMSQVNGPKISPGPPDENGHISIVKPGL